MDATNLDNFWIVSKRDFGFWVEPIHLLPWGASKRAQAKDMRFNIDLVVSNYPKVPKKYRS